MSNNKYLRCVDADGEHYVHEDALKDLINENDSLKIKLSEYVDGGQEQLIKDYKQDADALKQALQSESAQLIKERKEHTKERDDVYEANKRVSDQLHEAQDEIKFLKSVIRMFDKLSDKIGEY